MWQGDGAPLDDTQRARGSGRCPRGSTWRPAARNGAPAAPETRSGGRSEEEAESEVFAALCGKLDALAHFHCGAQAAPSRGDGPAANVPAVAVEDIARRPLRSASMLAPEEVYAGGQGQAGESVGLGACGGLLRDGAQREELESEDRKRLRSKLKRKWKGTPPLPLLLPFTSPQSSSPAPPYPACTPLFSLCPSCSMHPSVQYAPPQMREYTPLSLYVILCSSLSPSSGIHAIDPLSEAPSPVPLLLCCGAVLQRREGCGGTGSTGSAAPAQSSLGLAEGAEEGAAAASRAQGMGQRRSPRSPIQRG